MPRLVKRGLIALVLLTVIVAIVGNFVPHDFTIMGTLKQWNESTPYRIWPAKKPEVPRVTWQGPMYEGEIKGFSTDYKITVATPWDAHDPIGSIYLCWDALKAKSKTCGTCVMPPWGRNTLGEGRTSTLTRRSGTDALCFVAVS
jgi:hypothetical protein